MGASMLARRAKSDRLALGGLSSIGIVGRVCEECGQLRDEARPGQYHPGACLSTRLDRVEVRVASVGDDAQRLATRHRAEAPDRGSGVNRVRLEIHDRQGRRFLAQVPLQLLHRLGDAERDVGVTGRIVDARAEEQIRDD
jgi:hypothetical protein